MSAEEDFFKDQDKVDQTFKRIRFLKDSYQKLEKLIFDIDEAIQLIDLYEQEEQKIDFVDDLKKIEERFIILKNRTLLKEKEDPGDCFLTIHSGAGGVEACDWVQMLLRMYLRYIEDQEFKSEIIDILEDEGGLKSVTLMVSGSYAFGYLKSEIGIHRLVRISPFDSNKRRHTSFAAVDISPVIDDDINIEIKQDDIKIDTYRASGAGGQHVNKTDSAVRITHLETNIVVQCQSERSQIKNKSIALKVLKSRLYEYYKDIADKEAQAKAAEKKNITWGSQIRSYVFQPYTMVKDLRTNYSTSNVQKVMDGGLDEFIQAYLLFNASN